MAYWRLILRLVLITSVVYINVSGQDGEVVTEADSHEVVATTTVAPVTEETPGNGGGVEDTSTTAEQPAVVTKNMAEPKLNILFTYEEPSMKQVIDTGLELIRAELSNTDKGYGLGTVEYFMAATKNNDAIKVVSELCHQVDAVGPDLVIDFTKFGIPSEAVKVITKTLQIPTVSTSIGGPGALREWRNLRASEAKYLVQINPPEDFALRVVRSLATKLKIPNLAIFHTYEFEMFHHQRMLLLDVATKHIMIKIGKNEQEIVRQLAHLVASYFTNFFIAGSLVQIESVLKAAARLPGTDLFDRQHSWYSLSLEPGIPTCKGCEANVSVVHIQPTLARQNHSLSSPDIKDPRHDFQLNLILDTVKAAGHLKANGSWPVDKKVIPCVNYKYREYPEVQLDLRGALETVHMREDGGGGTKPFYELRENGENHTPMILHLLRLKFEGSAEATMEEAGSWHHTSTGYELQLVDTSLEGHVAKRKYRVVTVVPGGQSGMSKRVKDCGGGALMT